MSEFRFTKEIRLDNTKRSTYSSCLRKGFWQYYNNWQSQMGSTALLFGSTWHGFQEGFYGSLKETGWGGRERALVNAVVMGKKVWDRELAKQEFFMDYRTLDTCSEAFLQYVNFYDGDRDILNVLHTEQVFACPIELKGEREHAIFGHLPPIVFTGKLDLQVEMSGSNWIIEHKTTGMALAQQAYRLHRSPQIMGYSYAAPRVLNFEVEGCLISFLHASARKNKDGVYGKTTLDFKRVPQLFNKADLAEWRLGFLNVCKSIYECEENDYWPMNHDQCYSAFGGCPYIRLCEQNRVPEEVNYEGFLEIPWDVEKEAV